MDAFFAQQAAAEFHDKGWVLVALEPGFSARYRAAIENGLSGAPEYKQNMRFDQLSKEEGRVFQCGGTSLLGFPSSFHMPASRHLRKETADWLKPFFQAVCGEEKNKKLGINIDRLQVRPPGASAAGESWHRDVPASLREGEVWIGGMVPLDGTPISFCALTGTQANKGEDIKKTGFAKIGKGDHAALEARLKAQAGAPNIDKRGHILVPPDHILLHNPTLIHKVYPGKKDTTSVKQFIGFRLTPYDDSGIMRPDKSGVYTVEEIQELCRANAVMPLSSGQTPPMYPGNYLVCVEKQLHLFESFERDMLVEGAMRRPLRNAQGKIQHSSRDESTRAMKSLEELFGRPNYEYSQQDLDLLRPQPLDRKRQREEAEDCRFDF